MIFRRFSHLFFFLQFSSELQYLSQL